MEDMKHKLLYTVQGLQNIKWKTANECTISNKKQMRTLKCKGEAVLMILYSQWCFGITSVGQINMTYPDETVTKYHQESLFLYRS